METIEERAKEYGCRLCHLTNEECNRITLCTRAEIREMHYKEIATEQKAIDEQVRSKKCEDMTQEECDREAAFAEWYRENGKGTPTYSDAIEWARKEIIDKACEWLDTYLMEIGYPDDWCRDSKVQESGEKRFRKAMEE